MKINHLLFCWLYISWSKHWTSQDSGTLSIWYDSIIHRAHAIDSIPNGSLFTKGPWSNSSALHRAPFGTLGIWNAERAMTSGLLHLAGNTRVASVQRMPGLTSLKRLQYSWSTDSVWMSLKNGTRCPIQGPMWNRHYIGQSAIPDTVPGQK
jgi:hypothetical protein